jgi:hypothetical protein
MAKIPGGGHRGIDPVSVAPVFDRQALLHILKETFGRGNPTLKTAVYADTPESSLLKLAGVKNFSAFARGAHPWSIDEKGGSFEILFWKKGPVRGWVPDPEKSIKLPSGSTEDDVINRMVAILQEAAAR